MPATAMVEMALASVNASLNPTDALPLYHLAIQSPLPLEIATYINVDCRLSISGGRVELCSRDAPTAAAQTRHLSAATGTIQVSFWLYRVKPPSFLPSNYAFLLQALLSPRIASLYPYSKEHSMRFYNLQALR